ncbi:hypothetical protein [Streptomyces sp. NPDC093970]|uniref:WXG100 family type VII secretion target n=1 Tax=Streptomyces sp. NPDC093970 TaxID=3155076 RepID=UPI003449ECE5
MPGKDYKGTGPNIADDPSGKYADPDYEGATSDYDSWDWLQIFIAINGGGLLDATSGDLGRTGSIADPGSFYSAAQMFQDIMELLDAIGTSLTEQAKALAGKDGAPWTGPAADAFTTMMGNFTKQVQSAATALKGSGGPTVPEQLNNSGSALALAQSQSRAIIEWYAQQAYNAVYQRSPKDTGHATDWIGDIGKNPLIESWMTQDMRTVLRTLGIAYAGVTHDLDGVKPAPIKPTVNDPNTKGSGNGNNPDVKQVPPPGGGGAGGGGGGSGAKPFPKPDLGGAGGGGAGGGGAGTGGGGNPDLKPFPKADLGGAGGGGAGTGGGGNPDLKAFPKADLGLGGAGGGAGAGGGGTAGLNNVKPFPGLPDPNTGTGGTGGKNGSKTGTGGLPNQVPAPFPGFLGSSGKNNLANLLGRNDLANLADRNNLANLLRNNHLGTSGNFGNGASGFHGQPLGKLPATGLPNVNAGEGPSLGARPPVLGSALESSGPAGQSSPMMPMSPGMGGAGAGAGANAERPDAAGLLDEGSRPWENGEAEVDETEIGSSTGTAAGGAVLAGLVLAQAAAALQAGALVAPRTGAAAAEAPDAAHRPGEGAGLQESEAASGASPSEAVQADGTPRAGLTAAGPLPAPVPEQVSLTAAGTPAGQTAAPGGNTGSPAVGSTHGHSASTVGPASATGAPTGSSQDTSAGASTDSVVVRPPRSGHGADDTGAWNVSGGTWMPLLVPLPVNRRGPAPLGGTATPQQGAGAVPPPHGGGPSPDFGDVDGAALATWRPDRSGAHPAASAGSGSGFGSLDFMFRPDAATDDETEGSPGQGGEDEEDDGEEPDNRIADLLVQEGDPWGSGPREDFFG